MYVISSTNYHATGSMKTLNDINTLQEFFGL